MMAHLLHDNFRNRLTASRACESSGVPFALMVYTVVQQVTPVSAVYVLREEDPIPGGSFYRFVCATDDAEEAARAAAVVREHILTRELR